MLTGFLRSGIDREASNLAESHFRSSLPGVFLGKVFWKYAANLKENPHDEVWSQ